MLSSQLGRTVLSGTSHSQDQQVATPNDEGGYSELMDLIDHLIESSATDASPDGD